MHHLQVTFHAYSVSLKVNHCRSKASIKESDKHMREILDVLKVKFNQVLILLYLCCFRMINAF